jgi:hypothetical protein
MKEKLKVCKTISVPVEIAGQLVELRNKTHEGKYGWTAIFMRGYHALMNSEAEGGAPELAVKLEKLAAKLNFYVQHSVQLEEEISKLRAEKGK